MPDDPNGFLNLWKWYYDYQDSNVAIKILWSSKQSLTCIVNNKEQMLKTILRSTILTILDFENYTSIQIIFKTDQNSQQIIFKVYIC